MLTKESMILNYETSMADCFSYFSICRHLKSSTIVMVVAFAGTYSSNPILF